MLPPYFGSLAAVVVVVDTFVVVGGATVVDVFVVVDAGAVVDIVVVDVVVCWAHALSTKVATNNKLNPTHKNFLFNLFSFAFLLKNLASNKLQL
jgi:hypothetical protein